MAQTPPTIPMIAPDGSSRVLAKTGACALAALLVATACSSGSTPNPDASTRDPDAGSGADAPQQLSRDELLDPSSCAGCHPTQYREWSGSMHAYATDDPIFVAMNRRAQRLGAVGDLCIKCHAPMAVNEGVTTDGLNVAEIPAKLKGVTCFFCHLVDEVTDSHNNPLHLAGDLSMRAAISDPFAGAPHGSQYSILQDRMRLESSTLCGSCHDVVNGHGVQLERTFAEWQASVFAHAPGGTTCGQCHMQRAAVPAPVANVPGAPARSGHAHTFAGVDLAITPFPETDAQRTAVQASLDATIQSALCVKGTGASSSILVVLDNVGAGHAWPSGAAQDRRAWVEVTAYQGGSIAYQSGAIPDGDSPVTFAGTEGPIDSGAADGPGDPDSGSSSDSGANDGSGPASHADPDLWLVRDCIFDSNGNETHMFWEAADHESNQLPALATFDQTDPRFYATHAYRTYPRRSGSNLGFSPDRVTMRVRLSAIGTDVLDDLIASGDLDARYRDAIAPLTVGDELEWTAAGASQTYLDQGVPVTCVSKAGLLASASKVPAPTRTRCSP